MTDAETFMTILKTTLLANIMCMLLIIISEGQANAARVYTCDDCIWKWTKLHSPESCEEVALRKFPTASLKEARTNFETGCKIGLQAELKNCLSTCRKKE